MDALLNNSIFHHLLLLSSPDGATSSEIEICEKISRCNPSPIAIHSQRLTRLFWKGEYRNYVYHNRGMFLYYYFRQIPTPHHHFYVMEMIQRKQDSEEFSQHSHQPLCGSQSIISTYTMIIKCYLTWRLKQDNFIL